MFEDKLSLITKHEPSGVTAQVITIPEVKPVDIVVKTEPDIKPFQTLDANSDPDIPVNDIRVESFLEKIVLDNLTDSNSIYDAFRRCGFSLSGNRSIDYASMRYLLHLTRVKSRLAFLRQSELELNSPNTLSLIQKFNSLIETEDLKPADKINALNSLAKVAGLLDRTEKPQSNKIAIYFNSEEGPKIAVSNTQK